MRTAGPLLALLIVAACGAKTGVELEATGPSPPPDAGFDTFPCRWSLTQPTEVARSSAGLTELIGAVHGSRDEIAVLARLDLDEEGHEGARLTIADPPRLIGPASADTGGELMGFRGGWAQLARRCEQLVYDDAFEVVGRSPIRGAFGCALEPSIGRFEVTLYGAAGIERMFRQPDLVGAEARAPVYPDPTDYARTVAGDGLLVLSLSGGFLRGHRDGMGEAIPLGPQTRLFDVGYDAVRPAAVILRERAPGRWLLERVPFHASPDLFPLAPLDDVPAPFGQLATNETEALFALTDGRVAAAPTSGTALRFVGPLPEGPPTQMRVILRPGTSTGGVLYAHDEGDEQVLRFRALVCNR